MSQNLELLHSSDMIGTALRITVADGRQLTGVLLALDNKPNLLVENVIEYSGKGNENRRELGLVSVPFTSLKKVEMLKTDLDKTLEWKSQII